MCLLGVEFFELDGFFLLYLLSALRLHPPPQLLVVGLPRPADCRGQPRLVFADFLDLISDGYFVPDVLLHFGDGEAIGESGFGSAGHFLDVGIVSMAPCMRFGHSYLC